jgi:hypothetical protein
VTVAILLPDINHLQHHHKYHLLLANPNYSLHTKRYTHHYCIQYPSNILPHFVTERFFFRNYNGGGGGILWHRLTTLFGFDDEDDTMEDYTDEEMERMKVRPGIERALDVEHSKVLRRVGIDMGKSLKTRSNTKLGKIPMRK